MLVLSRKKGESVEIVVGGVTIIVKLTEIYGGKVRLGIEAPGDAKILRTEIAERLRSFQEVPGHAATSA